MADEPEKKEGEEEKTEEEKGEDKEESSLSMVEKANLAALRQEEANRELKALLDRQERLAVQSKLGGESEGGAVVEKKEETPQEYKNRIMAGTPHEST